MNYRPKYELKLWTPLRRNLYYFGLVNGFSYMTQKVQKIDTLVIIKIKTHVHQENKKIAHRIGENTWKSYISNQGLIFRIC